MENNHRKSRAELVRRYLVFGTALLIVAFGISIITRSNLGTSPISSIPYVASLNTPLTMGTYFFFFTIFLIILQRRNWSCSFRWHSSSPCSPT